MKASMKTAMALQQLCGNEGEVAGLKVLWNSMSEYKFPVISDECSLTVLSAASH